ncbi:MAG TPA: hypothetical protein VGC36_17300 [Rhizomicrobium sp.]
MTFRRKLILLSTSLACAYTVLVPTSAPSLGTIECAAPQYFDALDAAALSPDQDAGMNALREQAGLALAQLRGQKPRTKIAGIP